MNKEYGAVTSESATFIPAEHNLQDSDHSLTTEELEFIRYTDVDQKVKDVLQSTISSSDPIRSHKKNKVIHAFKELAYSVESSAQDFRQFVDIAMIAYPRLKAKPRKKLHEIVYSTAEKLNREQKGVSAADFARWLDMVVTLKGESTIEEHETVKVGEVIRRKHEYEALKALVLPEHVEIIGGYLQKHLSDSTHPVTQMIETIQALYANMHESEVRGILNMFEAYGVVTLSKQGKIKPSPHIQGILSFYQHIDSVDQAMSRVEGDMKVKKKKEGKELTMDTLQEIYAIQSSERKVTELSLPSSGEFKKRLHIAGLALGHQDAAIEHVRHIIDLFKELPTEYKPDVIVLSNCVAGGFENRQKNQLPSLVDDLKSIEAQFSAFKIITDELRSLGIPIVINLGSTDWEIARDLVIRMMTHQMNLVGHIPYYRQDQLQRMHEWSQYDEAATTIILPYCYRTGTIPSPESLLVMYDIYKQIKAAKKYHKKFTMDPRWEGVVDWSQLSSDLKPSVDGQVFITDDVRLTIGKKADKQTHVIFDGYNFNMASVGPMYTDPLKALKQRIIQSLGSGAVTPGDSYTVLNQHLGLALELDPENTWIESVPAARLNQSLETRGVKRRSQDVAHRQTMTRRQLHEEASMLTLTKNGIRQYAFLSPTLLDVMDTADRTTIIFGGDEQTGSVTARPDLLVTAHDIATSQLTKNKVIWGHFGDQVQGLNYKEKPHQESAVGMQIDVDSQTEFFNHVLEMSLDHVRESDMNNLQQVILIPGNHELNSGFGRYGISHMLPIQETWNRILKSKNQLLRTDISENMITSDGSFFKGWVANITIGQMQMLAQHYPMKKGGKGQGSLPIFQAWGTIESLVEQAKDIHFFHFQHWHFAQLLQMMGKGVSIGKPVAGQSEFEHYLGHRSLPGMMMLHVGGGLPPIYEVLSAKALYSHPISQSSIFSEESLNDLGFFTDKGFNPKVHGFIPWVEPFSAEQLLKRQLPKTHPRSALQKFLWQLAQSIPVQAHTQFHQSNILTA